MKKKIIFSVVLVALLTFLLAICISAVNPVFDYDEARTAKLDNGKLFRFMMKMAMHSLITITAQRSFLCLQPICLNGTIAVGSK